MHTPPLGAADGSNDKSPLAMLHVGGATYVRSGMMLADAHQKQSPSFVDAVQLADVVILLQSFTHMSAEPSGERAQSQLRVADMHWLLPALV